MVKNPPANAGYVRDVTNTYPGSVYMAGVKPLASDVSLGVIRFVFLVP